MYDLNHGQVFTGQATGITRARRTTLATPKNVSRRKIAAILIGFTIGATTTAGAVTVHRHKADDSFHAQWSASATTVLGSTGFAVASY